MIGHFIQLLGSIAAEPSKKIGLLPMLTAAEQQQLLVEFNDTSKDYPKDKTIIDLLKNR
ncbi:MAG: hypothetical protein WKF59_24010 [Chitinophagaceae bacterium]